MSEQEQQEQQEQKPKMDVEFILFSGDPRERMDVIGMFSAVVPAVKGAQVGEDRDTLVPAYNWESDALEWLADPERVTPLELRDGQYWLLKRPKDGEDDYYITLRRVIVTTSRFFRNW